MYILSCRDAELTRSREFYASVNSLFLSRFIVSRGVQIKSTFRLQMQDFNTCPVSCRNITSAQEEEKVFHCDSALVKRKQAIQPRIHVLGCRWPRGRRVPGQGPLSQGHCCWQQCNRLPSGHLSVQMVEQTHLSARR